MSDKNNKRRQLGINGEAMARRYLEEKGYRFVHSNYYTRFGELDLIFFDNDILVFVEVKTRKRSTTHEIEESINQTKINRIMKSAEIYIDRTKLYFSEMRYDVVFIKNNGNDWDIEHIKNFF